MDHSWGRNVAEVGLTSTGATLAAGYPGLPGVYLTNAPGFAGATRQLWFTSLNPDIPWVVHSVGFPPSFGNFPYHENVIPDVPL